MGKGLSTYLAPRKKCLLLGAEVSILCSSPQLQGLWRPMGSAQAGWADRPLPHPTPGTQDWRLAEGGASVATSLGGECSSVGAGGLGLSPQQEAVEGPSAGTLVQAGGLWQQLHTERGVLHALRPPLKGSEGSGLSGDRDKLKAAASSGAAPKRTEVDFHGHSVLLA